MLTTTEPLKRWAFAGLAAAVALGLAACGSSKPSNPLNKSASKGTVVIGSANFPENELLAEIYSLALKAKGVKVTDKFNIGSREIYYPEVKSGAVSIIPEYNGTLLTVAVDPTSTAATTAQVNAALTAKLPTSMEILNSSSAQDSDSVTVTQAFATKHHLTTASSIGALAPFAKSMVFGGPPEFKTRSDGLAGLKKNYGLKFKGFDALDESGPITLKALTTNKVQAADVFTTTPQIITDHLLTLSDPKFNFAAQNVTPLVYKKAMTSTITSTLNAISAKLTTAGLLAIDKAVEVDHQSYASVAAGWLKAEGLPGGS
jgi:osmoprotectant transport system substrate-binding protein